MTADDPRPTTDDRVAWTATLGGSPTADVDLCVRMMQGRVADAPLLKQRAGVSARGRKLRNPYAHFTAAWPPGQAPTRDEQLELADRALSALGLEDHIAVVIAHNDTDHAHWHLVVCKVHPDTGKAASLGRSGLRLSKIAEQWERVERFVSTSESQQRLRAGPLGRAIDGFAAWLAIEGYSCRSAAAKLRFVGDLSHWLEREELGVEALDEQLRSSGSNERSTTVASLRRR